MGHPAGPAGHGLWRGRPFPTLRPPSKTSQHWDRRKRRRWRRKEREEHFPTSPPGGQALISLLSDCLPPSMSAFPYCCTEKDMTGRHYIPSPPMFFFLNLPTIKRKTRAGRQWAGGVGGSRVEMEKSFKNLSPFALVCGGLWEEACGVGGG